MKILFGAFALLFVTLHTHAQAPEWSRTKNWKLYAGESQQVFSYPVDTLKNLRYRPLDQDSLQHFIDKAFVLSTDRTPTWMGSYLASYESPNGKTNKVEISIYGGFFYDQSSGKHYQLPRELTNGWLNYIVENMKSIKP